MDERLGESRRATAARVAAGLRRAPSPPPAWTSRRGRPRAGFHFLWLEMEHSPLTLETVRNIVLATRDLPAVPFARVPVTETWTAKRVLDAGVHGVIFPFVSTPELAQQAADACRYPPAGRRGIRCQPGDSVLAGARRLLRLRRSQRPRRRDRRGSGSARARRRDRRDAGRRRGLRRARATCRSRSDCADSRTIRASRRRRRTVLRGGAPARQDCRAAGRARPSRRSATSSRASCSSRRRRSSRSYETGAQQFLEPARHPTGAASAHALLTT